MRLFIASPAIIENYTSIREQFSPALRGKWPNAAMLHLTWVFLGEEPDPEPFLIRLRTITPLGGEIPLRSLGTFGHPPRILYAAADASELSETRRAFEATGFDMSRFRPHVTLCRIKNITDKITFGELEEKYRGKILGKILPEIALYQSTLTDKGPIYKKLEAVTM